MVFAQAVAHAFALLAAHDWIGVGQVGGGASDGISCVARLRLRPAGRRVHAVASAGACRGRAIQDDSRTDIGEGGACGCA